jgi:hypothetical protein
MYRGNCNGFSRTLCFRGDVDVGRCAKRHSWPYRAHAFVRSGCRKVRVGAPTQSMGPAVPGVRFAFSL